LISGVTLPVAESQVVKPDRIRFLNTISILLKIDRHSVPVAGSGIFVVIEYRRLSVQCDGLKQELVLAGSLYLNDDMIP
jgi:hypothetical protein